jgi:hypothetical protein
MTNGLPLRYDGDGFACDLRHGIALSHMLRYADDMRLRASCAAWPHTSIVTVPASVASVYRLTTRFSAGTDLISDRLIEIEGALSESPSPPHYLARLSSPSLERRRTMRSRWR